MVTKPYLVTTMPRLVSFSLGLFLGTFAAVSSAYLLYARYSMVDKFQSSLEGYFGPGISVEVQGPDANLMDGTLRFEKISLRNRASMKVIASASSVEVNQTDTGEREVIAHSTEVNIPDHLSLKAERLSISKISSDSIHLVLDASSIKLPPPLGFDVSNASISLVASGGNVADPMMVNLSFNQWKGDRLHALFDVTTYSHSSRLAPEAFLHPGDVFRGYLGQLNITVSKPGIHERLLWRLLSGGDVHADTISLFASEREAALRALPLTQQSRNTIRRFYESAGTLSLTLRPTVEVSMSSLFEQVGSQSLIDKSTLDSKFTPTHRYSLR